MRSERNFCEMPSRRPEQDLAPREDRAGWKSGGRSAGRLQADRQQIAGRRQLRGAHYSHAAGLRPQEAERVGRPACDGPQFEGVMGVLGLRSDRGNGDLAASRPGNCNPARVAALIGEHGNHGRYWRSNAARKGYNIDNQRGRRCAGGERQATPELLASQASHAPEPAEQRQRRSGPRPLATPAAAAPRPGSPRRSAPAGRPMRRPLAPRPGHWRSDARSVAATGLAWCREHIPRPAARGGPGRRTSCVQAPLQTFEAAPDPALDCSDWYGADRRNLRARETVKVGEQNRPARLLLELAEAALQRAELGTPLGARVGCETPYRLLRRAAAVGPGGTATYVIDRAMPHDSSEPARGRTSRPVIIARPLPYRDEALLQYLFRLLSPSDDS